jgi:hypothetical protein
MKTILNNFEVFKATIKPDGKIDVTLVGGRQLVGQLTDAEIEQFLFRVSVVSDGMLTFDPEPRDLVNVHDQDVMTLELQASELETCRATIKEQADEIMTLTAKLAEAENAATELGKRLLTVHNVQTTEQASSVHNVQSEATP